MIIDFHYHLVPIIPEEAAKKQLVGIRHHAGQMGRKLEADTITKKILDTFADINGEKLIAGMEKAGIDLCVICAVDNSDNRGMTVELMQRYNQLLGEIVKRYPGRVLALAGVDPRRPEASEMLKQCFDEFGVVGLKYHCDHGYYPNGPESYRLLNIVNAHKGVLLTHTGPLQPPSRAKYVEPALLADIGVDFPDIRVVAAHMGQVDWRPWANLAAHQPNLYGDLAMWDRYAFGNYPLFCRELRQIMDYAGAEKVLFGTDDPFFAAIRDTRDWISLIRELPSKAPDGIKFTEMEVIQILGGNAARILNL